MHELSEEQKKILDILERRFKSNMALHQGIKWQQIVNRLEQNPEKLWSISEMEKTGGQPDVVGIEASTGSFFFMDTSPETPAERRNLCYDRKALDARKKNKPANSAMDVAEAMGIEILTEAQYHDLQKLGKFDQKTSSWLLTPEKIRKLGGAIFGDRRYDEVFVYHNGADSYYSVRGFRGIIRI